MPSLPSSVRSFQHPDPGSRHGEMMDVKTEGAMSGVKYKIFGIPYLRQIVYCSCFCPK